MHDPATLAALVCALAACALLAWHHPRTRPYLAAAAAGAIAAAALLTGRRRRRPSEIPHHEDPAPAPPPSPAPDRSAPISDALERDGAELDAASDDTLRDLLRDFDDRANGNRN